MNTLTPKRKPIIGLVVPIINHSFFANIADQLTNLASKAGYIVSVFQSNESYELETEIIDAIIEQKFSGVIISISKNTVDSSHFKRLQEADIPLVFFDRVCENIHAPKVLIDNYEITYSVTEQLVKKGNKRIALIIGTNDINVFRERKQGYLDALVKHGLTYQMPVIEDEFSVEKGKEVFIKLWSSEDRPDAIISSSIQLTLGILLQTKLYDIKIPQKLDLITYVSHISFKILQPQITIIDQPENEIAEFSFKFLEKLISNQIIPENEMIKTVNAKIALKNI
ncbi:MAG: substrate-binding domain-containing protein [Paludibacter sp.]